MSNFIQYIKGNIRLISGRQNKNVLYVYLDVNGRKKKDNINYRKRIYKIKESDVIFMLIILTELIIQILSIKKIFLIEYGFSKITLKINGIGEKNIFCFNSTLYKREYYPNEVYINGNKQNILNYSYYFNQTENDVELLWNNSINDAQYMFNECPDIVMIDASKFDTSILKNTSHMFKNCVSLTILNLSNFNTSKVNNIQSMFEGCSALKSLDLSYIDTSEAIMIDRMFSKCSSLASINVSHFNTSKATDFEYLFSGCELLTSLDISNFDTSHSRQIYGMFSNCVKLNSLNISNFVTSNVKYMHNMFANCSSLTSLDLSNFNTSSLKNMHSMFSDCSSLISLNISNFDTSLVTNFKNMFYECSKLTSLDLSNFNTSNAIKMNNMFDGCIKLQYINLQNFNENNLNESFAYDIFNKVPDNIVICINTNNSLLFAEITKKKCYAIDCSNDWQIIQNKINNETGDCIHSCYGKYEYNEYNEKCYDNCRNGA